MRSPKSVQRPDSMFPTILAFQIASEAGFFGKEGVFYDEKAAKGKSSQWTDYKIKDALIDVQKMALAGQSKESMHLVFRYWVGRHLTEGEVSTLDAIYEITPLEATGELIDRIGVLMTKADSDRDKLEACKVMNALVNGEDTGMEKAQVAQLVVKVAKGEL